MADADNEKVYAFVLDPEGLVTRWHSNQWDDPNSEPEVTPPVGQIAVHVPVEDLGGVASHAEFGDTRKAVIVDSEFNSWVSRASPPDLSRDIDPPDDGGQACTVTLSNGVMNSSYRLRFSRGSVSCNLPDLVGPIDAQGDGEFKLKVFGPGDFTVYVEPDGHADFEATSIDITVVAGEF